MQTRPSFKPKLLAATLTLFMAGCSVAPEKFSQQEIMAIASKNMTQLRHESAPVTQAIDLNEAFARAIKHNREARLKAFEAVVEERQLDVDKFDMLPELAAQAGYNVRSNYAASASVTFSGSEPDPLPANPAYSVSSDKSTVNASIGATWDVLDFGLSYYRAKQQSDRFLIAKEKERKVVHNIMQEVRNAYFRAVSAERLLAKIDPLIQQARAALKDAGQIEEKRAKSPMQALTYQRDLLETLRTLQSLRNELMPAKPELAALMGMNPGEHFELSDVTNPDFKVPELKIDIETMERTALVKRPELIEAQYNQRITQQEVRSAFLNLFPSLSLSTGYYYDNSDYLKYNDWASAGIGLNWNLMNFFKYGSIERLNKLKVAAGKQQALAASMSVISQVHIANIQYAESRSGYDLATQYYDVAGRIRQQVEASRQTQNVGELELIREELNTVLAELRRDVAYADLQNSFGRIMVSMGLDPLPPGFGRMDLHDLSNALGQMFEQWQAGQVKTISAEEMEKAVKAEKAKKDA